MQELAGETALVTGGASGLVRVPFPRTDRPVRQRRPALVIARPAQGQGPTLLWVLMITSAENRGWPGDVMVSDLKEAGLPVPSLVRTEKIETIEARDAAPLGQLAPADRLAVRNHVDLIPRDGQRHPSMRQRPPEPA